ncbi:HU family DNA-binding protein [Thalassococcus sp. BH17M4-6]|uniref:HU family DNA-binding protein n=1 Tax=Thalassococcus sp. BH17M4-6 TaxID=3413148 RepID=UPI003BD02E54
MTTPSARKPRATSKASTRKTTATRTSKTSTTAPRDDHPETPQAAETSPVVVTSDAPLVTAPDLKKRDLINAVVARSGVKKRDAKPAIEAALAILGSALSEGRDLNLPPLGKVKVQRQKKIAQGQVVTIRLRQKDEDITDAPDPLAQAAE